MNKAKVDPKSKNPIHHSTEESPWSIHFKGMKEKDIWRGFLNNLEYNIAKDEYTLTQHDQFLSLAYTIRERLIERWILTQQTYHKQNVKRLYYLSLEFLLGRLLADNVLNLDLNEECTKAMKKLGLDYEQIRDSEPDAGLGNGGLGRLAACFLDSMATLELPAIGYGIRYEFGIFKQQIQNGAQRELPEEWLQFGNPWEIERPEYRIAIKFYGKTHRTAGPTSKNPTQWVDTDTVLAIPYDTPVPGFHNNTVNTLRLWASRSALEFNLDNFNSGDYIGACHSKMMSENISKVLYPNDSNHSGKELRLKQQHFFTSASLQDIIRRYRAHNETFAEFSEKVAIQLNDTHPAISIAELMRLLVDEHNLGWDEAWDIVRKTFAYTNHTLMPEALEKWSVSLMTNLLPRHMEIIYEINKDFLDEVIRRFPGDTDRLRRMSFIEEGPEPQVRMAHLAIVGSHSVNGVAALHTELLISGLFKDFCDMWPTRFNNKTNGITPRRWLYKANPALSTLITTTVGGEWVSDLGKLSTLAPHASDPSLQKQWQMAKVSAKKSFALKLKEWQGVDVPIDFLYDVQVKRIHEYKRQLLNALHVISLYNGIRSGKIVNPVPRVVLFGGKAAPGYYMAKLIIKFINNIAEIVNHDKKTSDALRVHFLGNYRVSLAEYVIPAADLSEQISTAGTEASGTGNMKFALNGALTIGTMDGANIEISEEVGEENMFIFGLRTNEVENLRRSGYHPWNYYRQCEELRQVMDMIRGGYFDLDQPGLFMPLYNTLLDGGDRYMIMADFASYLECQNKVSQTYKDQALWTSMAIKNVANMGKFSSDRTIAEYNRDIWHVPQVKIDISNR